MAATVGATAVLLFLEASRNNIDARRIKIGNPIPRLTPMATFLVSPWPPQLKVSPKAVEVGAAQLVGALVVDALVKGDDVYTKTLPWSSQKPWSILQQVELAWPQQ